MVVSRMTFGMTQFLAFYTPDHRSGCIETKEITKKLRSLLFNLSLLLVYAYE